MKWSQAVLVVTTGSILLLGIVHWPKPVALQEGGLPSVGVESSFRPVTLPQQILVEAAAKVKETDKQIWLGTVTQVIADSNDNDNRLDQQYANLSVTQRQWLQELYMQLPEENLNQRGKVALLLARQPGSSQDLLFLQDILNETPCRSLGNCKVSAPQDAHLSSLQEVSLNYPQLVVLYQLQKHREAWLQAVGSAALRQTAEAGLRSAVGPVQDRARDLIAAIEQ